MGSNLTAGLVDGLTGKQSQERLAALLDPKGLEAHAAALSRGLLAGALEPLGEQERNALIRAQVSAYIASLGNDIETQVTPRVRQLLVDSIKGSLDEALSAERSSQLERLTSGVVSATVESFGLEASAQLTDAISPAVHDALVYYINPGLQDTAKSVLAPLSETLNETLTEARDAADRWRLFALLVVGLTLLTITALSVLRLRRVSKESRSQERAIELLTMTIKRFEESSEVRGMVASLREGEEKGGSGNAYLKTFLDERPHIKIRKES